MTTATRPTPDMMMQAILTRLGLNEYRSVRAYDRYLTSRLKAHPNDRELAFAQAIGAETVELFRKQGDGHVAVLRHHGLADGMSLFDLGCGCGRTAQALMRSGWQGSYTGTDVVERFVVELERRCPGYRAFKHLSPSIPAPDGSIDMLFHWSVFTHLSVEECYLYLEDQFRALRPGGKVVFSFLELTDPAHHGNFFKRVDVLRRGARLDLLDTFLHRDWIRFWAQSIGFEEPVFTDGSDRTHHPRFWQAVVAMRKPLA